MEETVEAEEAIVGAFEEDEALQEVEVEVCLVIPY